MAGLSAPGNSRWFQQLVGPLAPSLASGSCPAGSLWEAQSPSTLARPSPQDGTFWRQWPEEDEPDWLSQGPGRGLGQEPKSRGEESPRPKERKYEHVSEKQKRQKKDHLNRGEVVHILGWKVHLSPSQNAHGAFYET